MWKAVNCGVQGRGHIKMDTPCQDKTKQLYKNGVSVIALADGAGSAKFSHFGADCVVENISVYVADNFQQLIETADGKQVKLAIMDELKNNLANKANELDCRLNDLASTLLLVAVYEDEYMILHIGDGVIGYLDGSELKIASLPDNGEFANLTTFVTSNEALVSMRLFKGKIKEISGFVIMSDGTEQSLYHKTTQTLANAIIKLMHRACLIDGEVMRSQLIETLTSVISKNTQDDCSIAIMVRPFGILRQFEELGFNERRELFCINNNGKNVKKRVSRYNNIISFLVKPKTLKQISNEIHLDSKYTKRHLDKLLSVGLIIKHGALYSRF
jgi:hypothetical protein